MDKAAFLGSSPLATTAGQQKHDGRKSGDPPCGESGRRPNHSPEKNKSKEKKCCELEVNPDEQYRA